jgi:orotate phosphoribosyltransferase
LSKLEGIKPLEELGTHVKHVVVVVDRVAEKTLRS